MEKTICSVDGDTVLWRDTYIGCVEQKGRFFYAHHPRETSPWGYDTHDDAVNALVAYHLNYLGEKSKPPTPPVDEQEAL
jgi:hypothetical protein